MVLKLKTRLSRWRMGRRIARFGNHHSRAVNLGYRDYHDKARRLFNEVAGYRDLADDVSKAAGALKRDGSLKLNSELTPGSSADLKASIDAAFAKQGDVYEVSPGLFRLMDGDEYFRPIINIMSGRPASVIEAYFGSYFKIYSITIYRTVPDSSRPDSSFLWHFDNCPEQQLKAMIYLDDVTAETGAFRFKSKSISQSVRDMGFLHRDDYEVAREVFDREDTTTAVEGGTGTVTLFQPGRVAHKATAPKHGHRDVAVLVLNPSLQHWREHFARNRHLLSTNAGLCLNLDTDEPENVGYRF